MGIISKIDIGSVVPPRHRSLCDPESRLETRTRSGPSALLFMNMMGQSSDHSSRYAQLVTRWLIRLQVYVPINATAEMAASAPMGNTPGFTVPPTFTRTKRTKAKAKLSRC